MSFDKLSPEEQAFATEHHGLLISFMRSYHLDEEMYGALSIRYLKTVHRYLSEAQLRRYMFSTILWLNLRSELSHELRKANRMPRIIPLEEHPFEASSTDAESYDELWTELERVLTKRELEVMYMHTQGWSYKEIAREFNITIKAVAGRLYRLRKRIRKM